MTAKIPLSGLAGRGLFVLVDSADLGLVGHVRWFLGTKGYVINRQGWRMHRLLLPDAPQVDHRNGNPLDNRRINIRAATPVQQSQNRRARKNSTHGFKGVSFHKGEKNPYIAQIKFNGRQHYLGCFVSAVLAAEAYDVAARKHYGAFARLNFPLNKNEEPARRDT